MGLLVLSLEFLLSNSCFDLFDEVRIDTLGEKRSCYSSYKQALEVTHCEEFAELYILPNHDPKFKKLFLQWS